MTKPGTVDVFSTCPQSKHWAPPTYLDRAAEVARWSEEAGCTGMLVYTDNGLVDPWLVAQAVIERTERLAPLVAVQPVYMHPYSAAKMVASLAFLHGRRVDLNLLAGGFRNDLVALGDETPHDDRYARTIEYAQIIRRLVESPDTPTTSTGAYYAVRGLRLTPAVPPELRPRYTISGSSPAGLAAARAIGATAVRYPQPPEVEARSELPDDVALGIRVGIVARDDPDEAWRVAHARFPADRKGQIAHALAMRVSDSHWHRQLSAIEGGADADGGGGSPYWLHPFENYGTFCPYLVGSYKRVGEELARYVSAGFRTVILDIPETRDDLDHITIVLDRARQAAAH